MNGLELRDIIDKIPLSLLTFIYFAYLGMDYYSFENDPSSALNQKKNEIRTAKQLNLKLEEKIKKNNEFLKTLDLKKTEIRNLAQELQNMKGVLPENLNVPAFMKMALTEAQKVGVSIFSLKPNGSKDFEYYTENAFTFKFRGVFVQLLAFFERISNTTEIIRIENFDIHPKLSSRGRYVELEGDIEIKAYRYLGSKADSIAKESSSEAPVLPSSPPPAQAPPQAPETPPQGANTKGLSG